MTSVQSRTVARAPAPAVSHTARLELLEYYLVHHEDLVRCAQASLDWLARHAGVRRSVCLAVDGETGLLVGIAGVGVPIDDVELFSASLADSHDPIVRALGSTEATVVRAAAPNGDPARP